MIFISHRGNIEGVDIERENSPSYIDEAIEAGFDVEIGIRANQGNLYLGHDDPQYPVELSWLTNRKNSLWVHVKDAEALLLIADSELRYFWHQQDDFTLTSNGYIWSHDFNSPMTDRCIVPLLSLEEIKSYSQFNFYAVCSDFVESCVEKFS